MFHDVHTPYCIFPVYVRFSLFCSNGCFEARGVSVCAKTQTPPFGGETAPVYVRTSNQLYSLGNIPFPSPTDRRTVIPSRTVQLIQQCSLGIPWNQQPSSSLVSFGT